MSQKSAGAALLNENQQKSLTITLRRLEKLMNRIEREAAWPEEKGRLYLIYNSLAGQPRQTDLLELVGRTRSEILRLADFFNLLMVVEDRANLYLGELAVMWEGLIENEAEYLRGYGKVNPALSETLDPSIQYLAQLVLKIQAATSGVT